MFFFFQAEDGIRDSSVTGVQTCALPIADKENHTHGHKRDGKQRRDTHRQRLRPSERPKHPSFLCLQQENREKRNHDDQKRKENGGADLLGGVEQNPSPLRLRHGPFRLLLGELSIAVLDHHDGGVDENPDGERKSAEGHDVRTDMKVVHRDESGEYCDRQRQNRNQRRAKMKKENNDDDADDDRLFQKVSLESFDGRVNQSGAVVPGNDFDTGRQRGFGLRQFFLHPVDDVQSVHAVTHDDDTRDGFSFALPLGHAFANIRAESDRAEIANLDGSSILRGDGHGFEIAQRAQITQTANHVFRAAYFEDPSADFVRAGPDLFDDSRKGNTVSAEFVGVDIDLVLLDESPDRRNFGNARNGFKLVAQIPVLNAAQLGETAPVGAIHENVLVHPACTGRIRANDRMDVGRQSSFNLLHVLENS